MHNPEPKGTVLFLHGFPETMYAWKEASIVFADEYKVHAFDWPGYGFTSRPTADRFSYATMDYARVLDGYIEKAHIDRSNLTIYATDFRSPASASASIEEAGHRTNYYRRRLRAIRSAGLHV